MVFRVFRVRRPNFERVAIIENVEIAKLHKLAKEIVEGITIVRGYVITVAGES